MSEEGNPDPGNRSSLTAKMRTRKPEKSKDVERETVTVYEMSTRKGERSKGGVRKIVSREDVKC